MWWKERRPEIVEDFDREVYGRVPRNIPKVTWELVSQVDETNENVPVIAKKLVGHVDKSSYPAIKVDIQLTLISYKKSTFPRHNWLHCRETARVGNKFSRKGGASPR